MEIAILHCCVNKHIIHKFFSNRTINTYIVRMLVLVNKAIIHTHVLYMHIVNVRFHAHMCYVFDKTRFIISHILTVHDSFGPFLYYRISTNELSYSVFGGNETVVTIGWSKEVKYELICYPMASNGNYGYILNNGMSLHYQRIAPCNWIVYLWPDFGKISTFEIHQNPHLYVSPLKYICTC